MLENPDSEAAASESAHPTRNRPEYGRSSDLGPVLLLVLLSNADHRTSHGGFTSVEQNEHHISRGDWLWFLTCVVAASAWCLSCAWRIGATFDEPLYIKAGLEFWRTGSHGTLLSVGTLPLAMDVQTLPLAIWEQFGRETPIDPTQELATALPIARSVTVLFFAMLLTYGWLIGRQLGGVWGGRLAVAWLACEPNLLAHASLVTADVPMAACFVAFLFHFQRGRESSRWKTRVGWPALWASIAVLMKLSAIIFGPLCVVAIEIERLLRSGALQFSAKRPQPDSVRGWIRYVWDQSQALRWDYGQVCLIATMLVFVGAGSDWKPEDDFVRWAHELPAGVFGSSMVWLSENLTIFPNAAEAFVRQVKHNMGGHSSYLLGHVSQHGVWYYFPVLLVIKLTVPLLAVSLLAVVTARRSALSWPLLCGLVLFAYSFSFRVQIGIRLILPAVALLVIGIGIALGRIASARRSSTSGIHWRPVLKGAIAVCLVWAVVRTATIWPHGLRHVNVAWGGMETGHHHVSDSNYDWGQGLPDLLAWQQTRGIPELAVWYFGTDPVIRTRSLRELPLHLRTVDSPADIRQYAQTRYLAVSTTLATGSYLNTSNAESQLRSVAILKSIEPVESVGTFLVYDLGDLPAAAVANETDGRPRH